MPIAPVTRAATGWRKPPELTRFALIATLLAVTTLVRGHTVGLFYDPFYTPVVLVWLAGALTLATSRPIGSAVLLLGIGVRVAFQGPLVHLHDGKAYGWFASMVLDGQPQSLYGHAWPALANLAFHLWHDPIAVHWLAMLCSALTASLCAVWTLELTHEPRAALAVGVAITTTPWLVAIAWTGVAANYIVAFLAGIGLAVTRRGPMLQVFGAASLCLLASIRPEVIPFAVAGWIALWFARRWMAVALGGFALGVRAIEFRDVATAYVADPSAFPFGIETYFTQSGKVLDEEVLHGILMDPKVFPVALVPLALCGAVLGQGRARHVARGVLVVAVCMTMLYLPQPLLLDQIRFQAASVALWASAAALGGLALYDRRKLLGWLALYALILSYVQASRPYRTGFPWQTEFALARRVMPSLPPGTVVYFNGAHAMPDMPRYIALIAPVKLEIKPPELHPGDLVWISAVDYRLGQEAPDLDALEPRQTEQAPFSMGGLPPRPGADGGTGHITIGLFQQR